MTDQPQGENPTLMETPRPEKPALTLVIQSWWTPALAVIALFAGLLLGYFGRPLLSKGSESTGNVAQVTTPVATSPVELLNEPTAVVDPTLAAVKNREQLMTYLVSQTTHFQGDPNAKVTIIEFSDYQ